MTRAIKRSVYGDDGSDGAPGTGVAVGAQGASGIAVLARRAPVRPSIPRSKIHADAVGIPTGAAPFDGAEEWGLDLLDTERRHLMRSLAALTPRECDVVCAICSGGAGSVNEAVADRLCIALPTLRTHLMRINQKLGTTSKNDLVRFVTAKILDGYRRGAIRESSLPNPTPIVETFGLTAIGQHALNA